MEAICKTKKKKKERIENVERERIIVRMNKGCTNAWTSEKCEKFDGERKQIDEKIGESEQRTKRTERKKEGSKEMHQRSLDKMRMR